MGRDKALLRFDGCSLVEHSLSKLRAIRFPPANRWIPSRPGIFGVEAVASSQSWNLHVSFHRWFENVNTPEDLVKLH